VSTEFLPATQGVGPLLQRDYWTVFAGVPMSPTEVMTQVKERFCSLPPPALASFNAPNGLMANATLNIVITPSQACAVQVVHETPQSFTLATVQGHPEAGRITFGSYRNADGQVIFHIRSRARSATMLKRIGFLAIGEAMQTNMWTDFIRNTAAVVGANIPDVIHADTQQVEELPEDDEPLLAPTFTAVGD
jgi:hypothetical protein